nr:integrase, catalytic region, zinc finger, CCHC-type, peptidase aspartic, catalytic [Tanacetum cinerariifolium]
WWDSSAQNAGVQSDGNQNGLVGVPGIANQNGTGNAVAARAEGATTVEDWVILLGTVQPGQGEGMLFIFRLSCSLLRKEKAGIQLQAEEFDFMAAAGDLDEIEEVNANCILMANLQQASTSGTQHDRAPIYDTDGSAEVVQICLWYVDSGCSKHMTGNIKLLINFVWKFLGTVRFGNDHIAAILGYGDL